MTSAAVHYDQLLAAQYTWMLGGDIGGLAAEQETLLRRLGVRPGPDGGLAVDLGCGPGQQSLALARIGFASVVAVDTSKDLLDELALHARGEGATGISPSTATSAARSGAWPAPARWTRWCAWATRCHTFRTRPT